MDLLLLRHADANTEADNDDDRKLSDKGEGQAKKVAKFIKSNGLEPDLILTSPIRRAQKTAEIVAEHLDLECTPAPWASCGMQPETATHELRDFVKFERVLLVGHEPDFSTFAAFLLGLRDPSQIRIRKASLTFLELTALAPGAARLQWSIPCRYF
jgi:phosphohistidine phosphatase